jgi:Holliday junction resolvase RusA-like endonuclease
MGRGGAKVRAFVHKGRVQERDEGNLVSELLKHRPEAPMEGPLRLEFTALFAIPKSYAKRGRAALVHTKKPDIDNLAKFLMDCLQTAQFFGDDAQVTGIVGRKAYSERAARWEITLAPDEGPGLYAETEGD